MLLGGFFTWQPAAYDPGAVVAKLFDELEPPGYIDIDEGVARMETVARHADRLARRPQGVPGRRGPAGLLYLDPTQSATARVDET
jgi:hypothetical protein